MSIASELQNYADGLDDAWDAAEDMGATIPADRNMVNLDDAIRTIPVSSPNDGVLTITQNGVTIQTFSADQATNVTAALTDTTYSNFVGATSSVAGTAGLVPAPTTSDTSKYLKGDGTWAVAEAELVEMYYGESNAWQKFIDAYNGKKIVYCRASSNANPGSGAKTRKAFMAYVNSEDSPTQVEFQYVRSASSKTDSQQCDQVFVYTLKNTSGGTWSVVSRDMATKINVDSTLTKTYTSGANASMTLSANAMTGATSSTAGTAGYVPAPAAGDDVKYLKGDGTWDSDVVYGYTDSLILSNAGHIWKDTSFTETFKASEIQGIVLAGKKFILVKRVSGTTTSVSQITGFSIGQIDPNDYGEIMFFMDGMPCTCIASTNNETWSLV